MTTAKSQQVSGETDSSDDLIAELAKLMAQDAHTDRGAAPVASKPADAPVVQQAAPAPVVPQSPTPVVRIPGMNFGGAPTPRFDFSAPVEPILPPVPVASAAQTRVLFDPIEEKVEPFKFDFGMPPLRPEAPVSRLGSEAPRVVVPETPSVAPSAPAPHDSIADLIAAEMPEAYAPEPTPVAAPIAVAPVAQTPAPQPSPEPAPREDQPVDRPVVRSWTPTQVNSPRPANGALVGRANVRAVNLTPVARAPVQRDVPAAPAVKMAPAPVVAPESMAEQPVVDDNFNIAPIFGLGGPQRVVAPVAPEPTVAPEPEAYDPVRLPQEPMAYEPPRMQRDEFSGTDPIDEIESLIGQAVRVDLDQRAARPVASPALRSLAEPEVARPVPAMSPDDLAMDDPVLEAVRASGAQVGWAEPAQADDESPAVQRRGRREKRSSSGAFRAIAGPLVAMSLLLVAGLGLYWVLGLGGRTDGVVPKLVADAAPIKQTPVAKPVVDDTKQSVVFNEIDGTANGSQEQLLSRDQADVGEVTQVAPAPTNDDGLANRKVRTVTVRPDGTIVSGDEAVAGTAILPVDRPNVPAVPGAETASPELLAAAANPVIATPVTATPVAAAPVAATTTPVVPGSTVAAVDTAGLPIAGKTAPVPMVRPATFKNTNVDLPAATVDTAPLSATNATAVANGALPKPAPVAAAASAASDAPIPLAQALAAQPSTSTVASNPALTPANGGNAPAYVQLSSQRSQADAQASAAAIQSRFGSLFGGVSPEIQRIDLGAKGIFFRVRIPAQSRQDAAALCSSVKANGGDCFAL
ncbi:SPOR domain-containing protein [Devosia sp.]|uniref:SPOR domain-containing protein n=1 Tax=Devosia sp. TaxID=1871048 RepID=UPI0032636B79